MQWSRCEPFEERSVYRCPRAMQSRQFLARPEHTSDKSDLALVGKKPQAWEFLLSSFSLMGKLYIKLPSKFVIEIFEPGNQ